MKDVHRPAGPKAPGPPVKPEAPHDPAPVDLAEESIAGEEDPGASLDIAVTQPVPTPVPEPAPNTSPGKDKA